MSRRIQNIMFDKSVQKYSKQILIKTYKFFNMKIKDVRESHITMALRQGAFEKIIYTDEYNGAVK